MNGISKTIRGIALFTAVAACVASCTPAKDPALLEKEYEDAIRVYNTCLLTKAKELDDGKSDIYAVAKIIKNACHNEEEKYIAAFVSSKGFSNYQLRLVYPKLRKSQDAAIGAILSYRKTP